MKDRMGIASNQRRNRELWWNPRTIHGSAVLKAAPACSRHERTKSWQANTGGPSSASSWVLIQGKPLLSRRALAARSNSLANHLGEHRQILAATTSTGCSRGPNNWKLRYYLPTTTPTGSEETRPGTDHRTGETGQGSCVPAGQLLAKQIILLPQSSQATPNVSSPARSSNSGVNHSVGHRLRNFDPLSSLQWWNTGENAMEMMEEMVIASLIHLDAKQWNLYFMAFLEMVFA